VSESEAARARERATYERSLERIAAQRDEAVAALARVLDLLEPFALLRCAVVVRGEDTGEPMGREIEDDLAARAEAAWDARWGADRLDPGGGRVRKT